MQDLEGTLVDLLDELSDEVEAEAATDTAETAKPTSKLKVFEFSDGTYDLSMRDEGDGVQLTVKGQDGTIVYSGALDDDDAIAQLPEAVQTSIAGFRKTLERFGTNPQGRNWVDRETVRGAVSAKPDSYPDPSVVQRSLRMTNQASVPLPGADCMGSLSGRPLCHAPSHPAPRYHRRPRYGSARRLHSRRNGLRRRYRSEWVEDGQSTGASGLTQRAGRRVASG